MKNKYNASMEVKKEQMTWTMVFTHIGLSSEFFHGLKTPNFLLGIKVEKGGEKKWLKI